LSNKVDRFNSAFKKLQRTQAEAGQITAWLQQRYYWVDFLAEMRRALIRSEDDIRNKMSAQKAGVDVGIWVERMTSAPNLGTAADGSPAAPMPPPMMPGGVPSPAMLFPGLRPGGYGIQQPLVVTNNPITLVCRAVNLTAIDPSANSEIAYAVENEMKNSPLVNAQVTQLNGEMTPDDVNGTFTFTVNVTPLNPLNF
jgi:hypothetical protein